MQLTVLELANNKLCALPPEIGVMTSLTAINCNDNWLKDLPIELRSLNMLRTFLLKGNRSPPAPFPLGPRSSTLTR